MDQTKSNFFETQILESIETIAKGIVSKLQFDQTILCTITNDDKKKDGIYEVTDGSSTFTATTSDTTYSKDTVVYVLIPQGNYDNQKTIIGKYVDTSASAVNYIPASESIIEIVNEKFPEEHSLLANGTNTGILINTTNWNNTNLYTCASLRAKFKTNLSQYNITQGSYGLVLLLSGYYVNEQNETIYVTDKPYYFNCSEMYGDPYNYNIYYEHDIVFDITDNFKEAKITNYSLGFYQLSDFIDLEGEKIPTIYKVNESDEPKYYKDNLFVKDIELIFGYTTSEIKEEGIKIYTPDDLKFEKREDKKTIHLKWFTQGDVNGRSLYGVIDELSEVPGEKKDFSIYWYRYNIGNQPPDGILKDDYWESIPNAVYMDKTYIHKVKQAERWNPVTEKNELVYEIDEFGQPILDKPVMVETDKIDYVLKKNNEGLYYIIEDVEESDTQKIIKNNDIADYDIIMGRLASVQDKELSDDIQKYDIIPLEKSFYNYEDELDNPFTYEFYPSEMLNEEYIKAVLRYRQYEVISTVDENDSTITWVSFKANYTDYKSNSLEFRNKNHASRDFAGVDLIRDMKLSCQDGSSGAYMIYNNTTNEISDPNKTDNILQISFSNYSSIDIPKEEEDCKITWKIPKNNTMIKPVNFKLKNQIKYIRKAEGEGAPGFDPNQEDLPAEGDVPAFIPNTEILPDDEGYDIEWSDAGNGYYECSYYWTMKEDTTEDKMYKDQILTMHYGIESIYVASNKNNTIICEIEKYGRVYKSEIPLYFGSSGVNGTKYTLYVSLEKEYDESNKVISTTDTVYLTKGNTNWVKVIAKLYDEKFKDITSGKTFNWNWFNTALGIEMQESENHSNECYIRLTDTNCDLNNYYGILKVTSSIEWLSGNTEISQYLPIGVRQNNNIGQYVGSKKVIYDAKGNKPLDGSFQAEHVLKNQDGSIIEDVSWAVKLFKSNGNEDNIVSNTWYAPSFDSITKASIQQTIDPNTGELLEETVINIEFSKDNILKLKDLYFKELEEIPMVIIAYPILNKGTPSESLGDPLFAQPLMYTQNQYGISMLNNWDGNQIIDSKGNKILTALVGAGIKNNNNTFSGVFLGDIEPVGANVKTGLIGMDESIQTFGFHTDGTAFIGAPGQGRINFDGTQGTISSHTGTTYFNLKEGSIHLSNEQTVDADGNNINAAAKILLDSNGKDAYFQISSKKLLPNGESSSTEEQNLIHIGSSEYYLQSRDYTNDEWNYEEPSSDPSNPAASTIYKKTGKGLKFDINQGRLNAYDFELRAGRVNGTENKEIIISSDEEGIPLSIGGDQFTVQWDGTMTAKNGYFTGNITANTGTIGGWTIVKNALFKAEESDVVYVNNTTKDALQSFNASDTSILLAPGNIKGATDAIGINNLSFTFTSYIKQSVSNTTGEVTSSDTTGWVNETTTNLTDEVVFAIGQKFAVTRDGTIYANGAKLIGYTNNSSSSAVREELINIAAGKVAYETTQREAADDQITKDYTAADTSITNGYLTADSQLMGRIGTVREYFNGAINQIGTYGNKAVFMDQGISEDGIEILYGYYNLTEDVFYKEELDITQVSNEISPVLNYQIFYDLIEKKYYKPNFNTEGTFQNTFTEETETNLSSTDLNYIIEGYYVGSKFYSNCGYKCSTTDTHEHSTTALYINLNDSKAYLYEVTASGNPSKHYRLTTPDDNIAIFLVSTDGLLQANNAVIGGTIHAYSGRIGGWKINHIREGYGGLTYNNDDATYNGSGTAPWIIGVNGANITPGEGLKIGNDELFGWVEGYTPPKISETDNIDYANVPVEKYNTKQCILNIGKKFAVDNEGILYASGGYFSGDIQATSGKIGNWEITLDGDLRGVDEEAMSTITLYTNHKSADTSYEIFSKDYFYYENSMDCSLWNVSFDAEAVYIGQDEDGEYIYKYHWDKTRGDQYITPTNETEGIGEYTFYDDYYIQDGYGNKVVHVNVNYDFYEPQLFSYTASGDLISQVEIYDSSDFNVSLVGTSGSNKNRWHKCYLYGDIYIKQSTNSPPSFLKLVIGATRYIKVGFLNDPNLDSDTITDGMELTCRFYGWCFDESIKPGTFAPEMTTSLLWSFIVGSNMSAVQTKLLPIAKGANIEIIGDDDYTYGLDWGKFSGDFKVLRDGSIEIFPGVLSLSNGISEKGLFYIDYEKYGKENELLEAISMKSYILPPILGAKMINGSFWSLVPQSNDVQSSLSIGYREDLNSSLLKVIEFTSDGYTQLFKARTEPFVNIYNLKRGGFKLNSLSPSEEFWPNALYTYNSITKNSTVYSHYVGFVRSVGKTCQNLSNVFLGCKQIDESSPDFPDASDWGDAPYNFYIRFDGRVKFEAFHTKKWSNDTKFAIRPNETYSERDSSENLYYLGTVSYPWDGLYLRVDNTTYNVNNLFDSTSSMTLNNVSVDSPNSGIVNVDTYQINGSNVLYSNASTGSTLNVGTVNTDQMNSKIYIPISSVKEPSISSTALATATNVNQNGWKYAARQLDAGGFSYYCIDSIRAGKWSSDSGVNVTWDIGIDGSSGKKKVLGVETVDKDKITFRYVINLVAAHDGTMNQYATYAPRSSFQFVVNRDTNGTLDGEWSYFINKRRHTNSLTYGDKMKGNPNSCLGHSDYPWGYGYITTIVNTNASSVTSIAETYANTSDIRLKDVQYNFDKSKLLTLYNILNPIAYKYKNLRDTDNHSRTHLGFLAQEVEQAVFKVGLTNEDYAIIQIEDLQTPIPGCEDGKKYYLNYNELHGLHVLKNQEQDKRILELEQKVQYLENKILELSGKGV